MILPDEVDRYLETVIRSGMFGNKAELARAAIVHFLNSIGPVSKGYDTDTFFSPDGRIFQVEYARESAMRGARVVGVVCRDGVLLASEDPRPRFGDAEALAVSPMKLFKVSDSILVGYSGMVSDALMIMDRLKPKQYKSEDELLAALRDIYWSHTTKKDVRPLGVGLLVATMFGRPRLFEVDPSGSMVEYLATCIGQGRDAAREALSKGYGKMTLEEAGGLVSKVLGEGAEYTVEELAGGD